MSTYYTIYNKELAPQALKDKQPYAPTYIDPDLEGCMELLLFIHTLEDVTGTPAEYITTIDQTEEELSKEDFDNMVNAWLVSQPSGAEFQMAKHWGKYLYDTRFGPREET